MFKLKLKDECQSLNLLADEISNSIAIAERIEQENMLLAEEQDLAVEIYSVYMSRENIFSRYKAGEYMTICSGVRVILDDDGFLLRLRRPLPFPVDFQPEQIRDIIPEFECHLRDLIIRNKALKKLECIKNKKIIMLADECRTADEYLDEVSKISNICKIVVTKYRMSRLTLNAMLNNNEPIL